jgi:polyisoprenoid-binding protein YceI
VTAFVPESAGTYALDKSHANIIFSVTHLGFSNYFGRFNNFDGTLVIDAAAPENSKVDITIDTASLDTNHDVPGRFSIRARSSAPAPAGRRMRSAGMHARATSPRACPSSC